MSTAEWTAGGTWGWAWAALTLYVVGLLLAFGLRTWVQLRQNGTSGFRGITGRPGSVAWWGGVLFPIALLLGLAAPLLVILGVTPHWQWPAHPVVAGSGLALGVVSLAVVLLAQHTMGASWRIGVDERERTELVTTGIFSRVRNPIFTGMAGVSAAAALMAPTPVAAVAVTALVAAVQIQVRIVEEPYLRLTHGQSYERYAATAGRFVPVLGRLSDTAAAGLDPAAGARRQ
ncbi:isoprenylcysteine carboxylmethyltransferase family protein [Pseudonocardia sp. KRD-184]|uniref:Isoprenylcysteine carboxylmethyltransferase family protein n=1 Tax=Pseudonocardia oceani TaxID=2792013 RepID=A0ABS6U2V7_9PSEU|nr:isoprenylcysteine carboxylmethyltransferase family protein [Pseudonocardia oceani]MBW0088822.1 isoprenylcysteine carboxylmethyltransferase family protein [Pseudonocardia oceani]MBW0098211.1 isoprenylcysteine carboxylmethyltransferase family protein [Pseudonocardia oceani]MBW0124800.1 isoprenylcysteine carboxylmethyltransferase family protein [Pseudonocardia oceani]MBW0126577.1 isoprenylcysteine carboxylmethyltransferase family protein [Pseudonocardia oceani]